MSSYPDPTSPRRRDSYRDSRRTHPSERRTSHSRRHSGSRRRPSEAGIDDSGRGEGHGHRVRRSSHTRQYSQEEASALSGRRGSSAGQHTGRPPTQRRRSGATHISEPTYASSSVLPQSGIPYSDREPMLEGGMSSHQQSADFGRKKSLVRPERRRHNPDEPDYYYRQHAQNMNVMPSTTGVDPQVEEDFATISSDSTAINRDSAQKHTSRG